LELRKVGRREIVRNGFGTVIEFTDCACRQPCVVASTFITHNEQTAILKRIRRWKDDHLYEPFWRSRNTLSAGFVQRLEGTSIYEHARNAFRFFRPPRATKNDASLKKLFAFKVVVAFYHFRLRLKVPQYYLRICVFNLDMERRWNARTRHSTVAYLQTVFLGGGS